ncbi:MAG: MaoC family dehydratase [Desulfobacteraceae bacterium]|nr:MaoC family dehydratase [Desulfobacteraceae bacterium]
MMQILSLEKMKATIGKEIGLTDWFSIDQERINNFANCTLDNHWSHVDVEAAKKGFFGETIAQGGLIVSLLTHFHETFIAVPHGAVMGIYYGMNKLRHLSPVKVGSCIRDRIVLGDIKEKRGHKILTTAKHTIEIKDERKPACYAETLTLFYLK